MTKNFPKSEGKTPDQSHIESYNKQMTLTSHTEL